MRGKLTLLIGLVVLSGIGAQAKPPKRSTAEWMPAKPVARSIITFKSTPSGARVMEGVEMVCDSTPCSKLMEHGKRVFRFELDRYVAAQKTVSVRKKATVRAKLEPDFGTARLRVTPLQAQVKIDGEIVNSRLPIELGVGEHRIAIDDPCYQHVSKRFLIRRNRTTVVRLKGIPRWAGIDVRIQDAAGNERADTLYVDGRRVGKAPGVHRVPLCSSVVTGTSPRVRSRCIALEEQKTLRVNMNEGTEGPFFYTGAMERYLRDSEKLAVSRPVEDSLGDGFNPDDVDDVFQSFRGGQALAFDVPMAGASGIVGVAWDGAAGSLRLFSVRDGKRRDITEYRCGAEGACSDIGVFFDDVDYDGFIEFRLAIRMELRPFNGVEHRLGCNRDKDFCFRQCRAKGDCTAESNSCNLCENGCKALEWLSCDTRIMVVDVEWDGERYITSSKMLRTTNMEKFLKSPRRHVLHEAIASDCPAKRETYSRAVSSAATRSIRSRTPVAAPEVNSPTQIRPPEAATTPLKSTTSDVTGETTKRPSWCARLGATASVNVRAICKTQALWQAENRYVARWQKVKSKLQQQGARGRFRKLNKRRKTAWLKARASCGDDVECTLQWYRVRERELRSILRE